MAIKQSVNHPIDCGLATTSVFDRQFAKLPVSGRSADILAVPVMRGVESAVGVSNETIGDINWQKTTFPVSVSDCEISVLPRGTLFTVKSVKSTNTSILANPTSEYPLRLAYQSNGTLGVEVELSNGERVASGFTTYTQSNAPTYTFVNHLSGSLAKHIYDQTAAIANGSTSSPNHYPIYSVFNFTSNVFVKNTACWAASLDFSGVSVNKSGSGGVTSVVMVTPRHAVGAAHYSPPADPNGGPVVGDKIYFCDSSNNTVERTVVAAMNTDADARIVKFDTDVPASVKKYKLLPANWKNYIPRDYPIVTHPIYGTAYHYAAFYVPLIVMSHYRWDSSWPLQRANRYAYIYLSYVQWGEETNGSINKASIIGSPASNTYFSGAFVDYNGEPSGIQGGDSGLPCFYPINGDLVFVMKHFAPASGSMLSDFVGSIQSAINSIGAEGHTLQTASMSGFTDFS